MRHRYILIGGLAIVLFVALLVAVGWYRTNGEIAANLSAPSIGGPFALTDGDGRPVTDQTYRGKWLLVYFGYTYCPDACPTGLNNIAGALKLLGPAAEKIQPLFITVDPGRDTAAAMKAYAAAFDGRIVGLTGTPEQIAAVARAYRVYYRRVGEGDDYLMDHSVVMYVMDPDGKYSTVLRHNSAPAEIADTLKKLL
jgi:cytochrome oxidase Cu insertion factor (SCO1/SenC/PrrC family)